MDWDRIERVQRGALLRLLVSLLAMLGPVAEGAAPVLPRPVHLAILRRLRALESSVRRLLIVAARDLSVSVRLRSAPAAKRGKRSRDGTRGKAAPFLALLDPRKRFPELAILAPKRPAIEPRIIFVGLDEWTRLPGRRRIPQAPLNPVRLLRRMRAVEAVLHDLPRHAMRLARWRARRAAQRAAGLRRDLIGPLRPGFPPGYRMDRREPVHDMLLGLDGLARMVEAERGAA